MTLYYIDHCDTGKDILDMDQFDLHAPAIKCYFLLSFVINFINILTSQPNFVKKLIPGLDKEIRIR